MLTTASLSTGVTYTVVATATDGVGLTGHRHERLRLRHDRSRPARSRPRPAGANVRGNAVTVSSNSADTSPGTVASATFQRSPIGAGTWTTIGAPDTTSPYSVAWDTTTGTPTVSTTCGSSRSTTPGTASRRDGHRAGRQHAADRIDHGPDRRRERARHHGGRELELRRRGFGCGERDVPALADRCGHVDRRSVQRTRPARTASRGTRPP